MGTLLAQQGNAAFSSWASCLPRMGRIGFWYMPDTFIFSEFSQRMRFLPSDNSSHQQTIQTIGWQSRDSQLSGCQNITTKYQMVWQFFCNSWFLLRIKRHLQLLLISINIDQFRQRVSWRFHYQRNRILHSVLIKSSRSEMWINYHFSRLIGFLDKILTLGNVNKFPFLSLNRIFALSVNKISGTSG